MNSRILLLFAAIWAISLRAQEIVDKTIPFLYFNSFSTDEGLPSPTTYNTYQDAYGFLWISTAEGLSRYDGYEFHTYFNDAVVGTHLVGACGFYEDEDLQLWVISPDGTFHFYTRSEDRFGVIDTPLSDGWVMPDAHSIVADTNSNLWLSGYGGLQYYNPITDSIKLIPLEKIRKIAWPYPEKVRCGPMVLTDSNILWIGTRKFGLVKYDITQDTAHFYRYDPMYYGILLDDWINTIVQIDEDHLLISDRGNLNLVIWNISSETVVKTVPLERMLDKESVGVNDIYYHSQNRYWLATDESGLVLVDIEGEQLISQYLPQNGISLGIESKKVIHVSRDINDTYWLGSSTLQQGSSQLYNFRDILHNDEDITSLPSNEIHDLSILNNGNLLISTTAGPTIYDIDKSTFRYPLTVPNPHLRTYGVLGTKEGDMWISTHPQLYNIDKDGKRILHQFKRGIILDEEDNSLRDAFEIIEDSNQKIWTVDRWGRLKYIDPESGYITNVIELAQDSASGKFVNILAVLDDPERDQLIVGTDLGIATVNRRSRQVTKITNLIQDEIDFSTSIFSYFYRDKKDQVWVIIDGLPYILDVSTFELKKIDITTRHDVGSVKWIVEEPADRYWFSSPKGIIKYEKISEESTLYPSKNVGGTTWDNPSPVAVSQGKIYFSGSQGLSILDPDAMHEAATSPKVRITNLRVNQEQVKVEYDSEERSIIKLKYYENDIDISMSNLVLLEQHKCQYAYRLLPRDDEWINNGTDNTLELYNLTPNDYKLEFRSSNKDGIWSDQITSLQIDITPPWWATMWARMLGLVMVVGGMLTVQRYLYHQRLENQRKLELLRTNISSDLHDDVGTILTGIAMQSELLETFAVDKNKNIAAQIAVRSRLAMSRMRDTVWAMDARKDALADLKDRMLDYADDTLVLGEIQYSFDSNIAKMGQTIKPNVRQAAYLIFKESITNIVKHSDTKEVEIRLDMYKEQLHLVIRDRGTQVNKINGSGLGMSNMETRALKLGGSYSFDYKQGYITTVSLPLKPELGNGF